MNYLNLSYTSQSVPIGTLDLNLPLSKVCNPLWLLQMANPDRGSRYWKRYLNGETFHSPDRYIWLVEISESYCANLIPIRFWQEQAKKNAAAHNSQRRVIEVEFVEHVRWIILKAWITFIKARQEWKDAHATSEVPSDLHFFLAILGPMLAFGFGDGCSFEEYFKAPPTQRESPLPSFATLLTSSLAVPGVQLGYVSLAQVAFWSTHGEGPWAPAPSVAAPSESDSMSDVNNDGSVYSLSDGEDEASPSGGLVAQEPIAGLYSNGGSSNEGPSEDESSADEAMAGPGAGSDADEQVDTSEGPSDDEMEEDDWN